MNKVEEEIKKKGVDEDEIKEIMKELEKANPSRSEKELRKEAVLLWEQELIDEILEERVRERLKEKDKGE